MSRYAIITHLDSTQQFAVLIETPNGVDTIGVSAQGKEWEKWADALPTADRRTIEDLTATLGGHLVVDGPKELTPALKQQFDELAAANQPNPADVMVGNTRKKQYVFYSAS